MMYLGFVRELTAKPGAFRTTGAALLAVGFRPSDQAPLKTADCVAYGTGSGAPSLVEMPRPKANRETEAVPRPSSLNRVVHMPAMGQKVETRGRAMNNSKVEMTEQSASIGAQADWNIRDWALAAHKVALAKSNFPQRVIDLMDHYSKFQRVRPDRLSREHRWTKEDIGKTFVGFEVPENSCEGMVFEVEVTAVLERSLVSFAVSEAYDLTRVADDRWSVWNLGPFSKHTRFTIDAENPITWGFIDRAGEILDDDGQTHERFRVFMAIQDWALQPILG
jgi:hypothetical protein